MILGKVVGTVVSTQKDEGLKGYKLLIVQSVDMEVKLMASYIIAADAIGAGVDEIVFVVTGSSARLTAKTKNKPVDAAVVGIVDSLEVGGKIVFRKCPERSEQAKV